jgi:hypothetical protein
MFQPIFLQSTSWEGVRQWMMHLDLVRPNDDDDAKRRQGGISHVACNISKCCDGNFPDLQMLRWGDGCPCPVDRMSGSDRMERPMPAPRLRVRALAAPFRISHFCVFFLNI